MKRLCLFLQIVAALECAAGLVWCGARLNRPALPPHNAAVVDSYTSQRLNEFRLGLSPDRPASWSKLAEMYLAFGSYPAAEASYRLADHLRPFQPDTLLGWGMCLERLGRYDEANAVLQRAARLASPQLRAEIRYRIGRNYQREDRMAEAAQAFEENAGFVPGNYQMAKILLRQDRPEEAWGHIEGLLRAGPDVVESNQLAELCCRMLGETGRAAEFRERLERCSIRLATSRTAAAFQLLRRQLGIARLIDEADQLEKAGRYAEACSLFETAWQTEATEVIASKVAELRLKVGEPEAALEMCRRQADVGGVSARTLAVMATAYDDLRQPELALNCRERANSMRIDEDISRNLARASDGQNDTAAALRYRALAKYAEGLRLFRANQIRPALTAMQDAMKLNPDHAPTCFYLGALQSLQGDPDAALASWQRCLTLDAGHGRAFEAVRVADRGKSPASR